MKPILSLLSVLFLLNACVFTVDRHIDIPDTINVTRTNAHRQIPGTRVLMVIPTGYKISGTVLKKADGTEIVIMDSPGRPFDTTKDQVAIPEETNSTVTFYQRNFVLNGYPANIRYGKIKQEKEDKIFFISGNNNFIVAAITRMPEGNGVDRDEIVTAIKSIIVDTSIRVDYSKNNRYTLDCSTSVFKFNKNVDRVFYYTEEGKGELTNNFVSLVSLPALPDTADMINCGKTLVKRLESQMTINSKMAEVVKINGRPAYQVIMKVTREGIPLNAYVLVIGDRESAVYYLAFMDDNKPALFEDCKKLAATLRLR